MTTIKLIDSTFRESHNLPFFKKLAPVFFNQLQNIGFTGCNYFSVQHYAYYLKEMNLKPEVIIRKFEKKKNTLRHFTEITPFDLFKFMKPSDDDTSAQFIKFLSNSGIDFCKIYDPLNDFNRIKKLLNGFFAVNGNTEIIGGIFLRPELPQKKANVSRYDQLLELYNQFGIHQISLIEPLGIMNRNSLKEILSLIDENLLKDVILCLKSNTWRLPVLIQESIDFGVTSFEIDNLRPYTNRGVSLPDPQLFYELDGNINLNFEKLNSLLFEMSNITINKQLPNVDLISSDYSGLDIDSMRILKNLQRTLNLKESKHEIYKTCLKVMADLGNPPLISYFRDMIISQTIFNLIDSVPYSTIPLKTKLYLNGYWGKSKEKINLKIQENMKKINFNDTKGQVSPLPEFTDSTIEYQELLDLAEKFPQLKSPDLSYKLAPEENVYIFSKNLRSFSDIDFSERLNLASLVKLILNAQERESKLKRKATNIKVSTTLSSNWRNYSRIKQMGRF